MNSISGRLALSGAIVVAVGIATIAYRYREKSESVKALRDAGVGVSTLASHPSEDRRGVLPSKAQTLYDSLSTAAINLEGVSLSAEVKRGLLKNAEAQELRLGGTDFSDADSALLLHFKNLKSLSLIDTGITDAGFQCILPSADSLEELDLSGCDVSDASAGAFKSLKRLVHVDLDDTKIGETSIIAISGLENLKSLRLARLKLSRRCLQELCNNDKITTLVLEDSHFPAVPIEWFEKMKQLKCLDVSGCELSDAQVHTICNLPSLQSLRIDGSRLSLQNVRSLAESEKLQILYLSGSQLSQEKEDILYSANPWLNIDSY